MPPQPGTPTTPAGGWRQQPPPWRPQPLPPPQRPAKGSEAAGWEGRKKRAANADWRAASLATGVERGGVRPGRSRRAENPGAEAALPSGMRRGGSRAALGGGRRGGCRAQAQGSGGAILPEPTPPSPASPPAACSTPSGAWT
ncbi:immediate early response gene 5 protein-like [Lemur catta]|uniref:immediate early response gene 5 protein-like n=1 Tax=Lemur catta TaxID=9447 RepID=UPI001E26CA4A|nr:immediate early response gene 5 protein-like [Lemur catta]